MQSTVMKNLQTLTVLPILALASLFIRISVSTSLRPLLTGPDVAYLGSRVTFWCTATDSSPPVTYELMGDGGVLINTDIDFQGDQSARFVLKVTATSEGSYHCTATAGGSTGVSNSIKLTVVTPASNTRVTSEPFPPVAYEGSRFVLNCTTNGSHLSYTWFFNRKKVTSSTSPAFHLSGNTLVMGKVTLEHAGSYYCMVKSRVQDTERLSNSVPVQLTVKVNVSKPRISFSISKEGASYHGNVTCWSTRGSPPVNFSLTLDDREVGSVTAAESLTAWFPVDMVPGLDMGVAQCRVTTEVQELTSEPVTLVVGMSCIDNRSKCVFPWLPTLFVLFDDLFLFLYPTVCAVPVGGNVKVEVEYLYRADSKLAAARLSCQVSRGTFPYVSWLFNNSVLPSETHVDSNIQPALSQYAVADHRRTLFLANLGPEESGYYRCKARDSYDDSGPWVESPAMLVRVTDTPMPTIEAITIAFCCFLLLTLAACVGCVFTMFDHEQAHAHVATTNPSLDALPLSSPLSQSEGQQADTCSTDSSVQNQTVEITV
ncbi:Fc receptor-like protein 5 isoform X2 [Acanthopagrus latus]|uniref:Fc receptor-like protein 5 isoform X2 n=1 Tax=Acanthopagrus latus TaxID=8177 RepID=UPI00187C7498|nr:Fc receptor-like protein 5 isoform X2 [Acanthopagrus latus]